MFHAIVFRKIQRGILGHRHGVKSRIAHVIQGFLNMSAITTVVVKVFLSYCVVVTVTSFGAVTFIFDIVDEQRFDVG